MTQREEATTSALPSMCTPNPGLGWIGRRMLDDLKQLQDGTLTLHSPDGGSWHFNGGPGLAADLSVNRPALFRKLLMHGEIGFAESYADGDWDSSDLTALLRLLLRNENNLQPGRGLSHIRRLFDRIGHLLNRNSFRGSRRNIAFHYDLGNDFYAPWLDPSMTYSAALFSEPDMTLEDAQAHKYATIANWAELKQGSEVLEVGCGWGAFARQAARDFGARTTGLTLSTEQLAYAQARSAREGLQNQTSFLLQDYRKSQGRYDAIVSIEMFEAVGETFWNQYFNTLANRLKPGHPAVLQVITIEDDRFERYRRGTDFIQKHIFPGGFLPSPAAFRAAAENHGFAVERELFFGPDYAETLAHWRQNFHAAWPQLQTLGFDERFRRLWDYYFSYCEAGFREGSIDVGLFKLRPSG